MCSFGKSELTCNFIHCIYAPRKVKRDIYKYIVKKYGPAQIRERCEAIEKSIYSESSKSRRVPSAHKLTLLLRTSC